MWLARVSRLDPVYIGLAVTSPTDGTPTAVTFDRECTFSAAELHADGVVDFKDFTVLADMWLDELLWPQNVVTKLTIYLMFAAFCARVQLGCCSFSHR